MIVGAQKSGTSSLLAYLAQDDDLVKHRHSETEAFLCADADDAVRARIDAEYSDEPGLRIAKHATLMYHPDGLERLLRLYPDCQLAVVLRNPVERAYSSYWYRRGLGRETEPTFEDALRADRDRAGDYRSTGGQVGYVRHGLYALHLEPLLARDDVGALHVHTFEDLTSDPAAVCRTLAQGLGSTADFSTLSVAAHNTAGRSRMPALSRWLNTDTRSKAAVRAVLPDRLTSGLARRLRRSTRASFRPPPMRPDTRTALLELFAPDVERLATLIDRPDVRRWLA